MLPSRPSPAHENHREGNASIVTKKTQIQRLNRGWRCGTNDALMKLPSLAPDSATRFFRTVSSRLTIPSVKSHLNSGKKSTPFNAEDQRFALTGNSQTGGGFPAKVNQTTSSSETGNGSTTGNGRTASSGQTEKELHTRNIQTLPSSETGRGFSSRSMSMAAFFRRVHSGHQMSKVEHTKKEKHGEALRSTHNVRLASDKDEVDSSGKRNSVFQRISSVRIRNRTTVDYKSLDDGNLPLDVDTGRSSFRKKLRKDVHRPALNTRKLYSNEIAKPSGGPKDTRGTVSDGEEQEDSQSSKGQRNRSFTFQRSWAIWRSFSAKSRARSNDVLLETTELVEHDSGCLQNEEIELELKLLNDFQQHRHRVGFLGAPNGFQNLLTQQHAFRNSRSRVDANSVCPSPPSSTPTKRMVLRSNDWQRYHHILDGLYEFNTAHAHYTEAGFVLCEHAQLCTSSKDGSQEEEEDDEEEWRRVEQLLLRAIEVFDLGRTWEYAIDICEYLSKIYKTQFLYGELSLLLQKQANLYRKILQEPRAKPCYFMVQFLGGDFPEVFSNKRFVLRTETRQDEYDLSRIISYEFAGAKRLSDDMDPNETVSTDFQRGYKLFKLKQVPSVSITNPGSRKLPDAVQFFHRYNNIGCFEVVGSCDGESKPCQYRFEFAINIEMGSSEELDGRRIEYS